MLLKEKLLGFRWFVPVDSFSPSDFRHQRLSRYYACGGPSIKPPATDRQIAKIKQTQASTPGAAKAAGSLQILSNHPHALQTRVNNIPPHPFALR